MQRLVNEFVSSFDAKIAYKADVEQLNDKMGRLETDDLLNQVNTTSNKTCKYKYVYTYIHIAYTYISE